jgi:hypothetical protein
MLWTFTGNSSLPFMQSSFAHSSGFQYRLAVQKRSSLLFSHKTERSKTYLRDWLDSVREIATVAMDKPDDGVNLAIFNVEGALLGDH